MIEKLKTACLVLLVAASLAQSYILAYSTPKFDRITQADYVETDLKGTQADLTDVTNPEQIILHFGNKKHAVLYPNNGFYNMVLGFLKKRTFDGFRRTNILSSSLNWDSIRNEQQGLEVRFKEGIPISVLKSMIQIKEDVPVDNDVITRIWIFSNAAKDEVKSYFLTDTSAIIYEAVKADVTVKDVEKNVSLGSYLPTYHSDTGDYYLPDVPLDLTRIQGTYTQFTPEKLKRSLFVDPELTRFLLERDGTQIYTDGKRGLQIRGDQHWLSYTDPVSVAGDTHTDSKDNLLSAVQFVNQHGGWNGTYTYSKSNAKIGGGTQTFLFRQYVEGLPIINPREENFGFIRLVLQKGVVSNYERSLIIPETKEVERSRVTLPGGKELDQLIQAYGKRSFIASVFPAYRAVVSDKSLEYVPEWAVELKDGTYDFLTDDE